MVPAISSLANIGAASAFTESQDLLQTFRTQAGITAGPVGLTIMRMRFHISTQDLAFANATAFVLGVRVMDSTEAALAETEAATFSPTADPHADWMCFEPFASKSAVSGPLGIIDHSVDVRSMRKLDELGQTLVAVVSSVPPFGGTPGLTINLKVTSSVLIALP